jgi:membrane dipeptidase
MTLIVDAHEDLAWNIQTYGRDYARPAEETRRLEAGGVAPQANGDTLLGYPDYVRGRVALVFATLFAAPIRARHDETDILVYRTGPEARELYKSQLDEYYRLVDAHPGKFRLVLTAPELEAHLQAWEAPPPPSPPPFSQKMGEGEGGGRSESKTEAGETDGRADLPIGLVPLMEGAECVERVEELEEWWQRGVRIIGPAWRGNRFCGGTREPGPLTADGLALLEAMSALGFTLDLSHMDREAALQALDRYQGAVIASHANALRLVKGSDSNRHLPDEVIEGLIARGGVIGVVPFNRFLVHGWTPTDARLPLDMVAAQIDAICQTAGDARHAGLGSDFDGGFGLDQTPEGIDTVADLQGLAPLLAARGYNDADVAAILGGNWIEHLRRSLP